MAAQGERSKPSEGVSPEQYARISREFKQDREQLELAKKRMGGTSAQLLQWVVDFAQSDLDVLRPEERQAKGYDLRALPDLVEAPRRQSPKALSGVSTGWRHPIGPMPDATLKAIHNEVGMGLRKLFGGSSPNDPGNPGLWELPKRKANIYRSSPDGAARTRFGIMWETGEPEEEAILAAAVDLILEAGGKLRACPECQRVFVSERRQVFCTTEDGQRARNREHYALKLKARLGSHMADRYRKAKK